MINRHIKSCSTSLIMRKMLIRTTVKCHLTSIRMAVNKKTIRKKTTVGEKIVVKKREPSCTVGGNINWYNHYKKLLWKFLTKLKLELPQDPAVLPSSVEFSHSVMSNSLGPHGLHAACQEILLLGIYLNKRKTLIQNDNPLYLHCSIIYDSQDMETTLVAISR